MNLQKSNHLYTTRSTSTRETSSLTGHLPSFHVDRSRPKQINQRHRQGARCHVSRAKHWRSHNGLLQIGQQTSSVGSEATAVESRRARRINRLDQPFHHERQSLPGESRRSV